MKFFAFLIVSLLITNSLKATSFEGEHSLLAKNYNLYTELEPAKQHYNLDYKVNLDKIAEFIDLNVDVRNKPFENFSLKTDLNKAAIKSRIKNADYNAHIGIKLSY